ncbi:hypothetical protein ARSEF4850_006151, partial [Beauveria asiatica]
MMLQKVLFLISLVHIAVADSLFEAYSAVTTTHRIIRQYRNSTSSAGSDTTIRELTLSTPTKTRQTTDHKSTSEVLPTVLDVDTRVTIKPSSSGAMVPTADQSPDSTSSEKSKDEPATPDDPVFMPEVSLDWTSQTASSPTTVTESSFAKQTEPALSASNSSPTRPAFVSSPATPTSTNRSPITGISTATGDPETGQPLIPSSSSASTSRLLSPSSETLSTPTKTTQTPDYTSISGAWPTSLGIGTRVTVEPTSIIALSPTSDQSIGSITSEATKTGSATPGYSASTPKVSLDSTSRTAGSPPTVNEDPFTMQIEPTLPAPVVSSPATPISTNRSPPPGIFTTTEDRGTSQPLVPTSSLALVSTSRPLSPSSTTTTEDAEQTKPHVHASVSPISTLEDSPSESASETTSISAAADVFANKAHTLQIDDTPTMGPEPMRNATAAESPDARVSTTPEDTTLNHSATIDTANEPTANSPLPSQLTTQAGSPTLPRATHSTGVSRTGSTPDSTSDIFANSGGQQTVKQKITIAGAAVGAVSGSALLGAAMLKIWSNGDVVYVETDGLPVKGTAEFLAAVALRALRRQHHIRSQPVSGSIGSAPQDCMPKGMPQDDKRQDYKSATGTCATEWQDVEPQIGSHWQK